MGSHGVASAAWTGARTVGRKALQEWMPYLGSADADTLHDLPALRARSRDLARNSPLGTGAIETAVGHIIGAGLRVQSQIDAAFLGLTEEQAEAWQAAAERIFQHHAKYLDITGEQHFGELQRLGFRSHLESGDLLIVRRHVPRNGQVLATRIQVVEADRVCNPRGKPDSADLSAGVQTDADGRVKGYHVSSQHPGDMLLRVGPETWSYVPAWGRGGRRFSKLLYRRKRPGQRRGVPYLAPVIEPLKQLERFTEAELLAAVISSFFTVFVKTLGDEEGIPGLEGQKLADDQARSSGRAEQGDLFMGPGAVLDLKPGEDIETASPNRPSGSFDPFFTAISRQIGVALNIPYEVLIKHFQSSYSAARAAMLDAWRYFKTDRAWFGVEFCQMAYEWTIEEAVARDLLPAPGFFTDPMRREAWLGSTWTGDAPGQIDPLKEVLAAEKRLELGISTLAEETAQMTGGDWEAKHIQRTKEIRRRREDGLEAESQVSGEQLLQIATGGKKEDDE